MSVTTQQMKIQYAGNGSSNTFPFPYPFEENADIVCKLYNTVTQAIATLNNGVDFTVSGAGIPAGGTIVTVAPPAVNTILLISRILPLTQESDYDPNAAIPTDELNTDLDRGVMIDQQISDVQSRTIQGSDFDDPTLNMKLPPASQRAGMVLGFDGSGNVTLLTALEAGTFDQFDGPQYGVATGSANNYAVSIFAYDITPVSGRRITVNIPVTNTGASTIAVTVAGTSTFSLPIEYNGMAVIAGMLVAGGSYELLFDGSVFQLMNPTPAGTGSIVNSQLAAMAARTIKGNATGTSTTPQDVAVPGNGIIYDSALGLVSSKVVSSQSGTSYAILNTDRDSLITFNNSSAVAATLPVPGTLIKNGFKTTTLNLGSGTVTITPASSTINGNATLALVTGDAYQIISDGTNYFALYMGQLPNTGSGGKFTSFAQISSSGTWTVPSGITEADVIVVGAGGNGGSAVGGEGGGGGGGGGTSRRYYTGLSPGNTATIIIGSVPGGTTSFTYGGVSISAFGGANGGNGGSTLSSAPGLGGVGGGAGTGASGLLNIQGESGEGGGSSSGTGSITFAGGKGGGNSVYPGKTMGNVCVNLGVGGSGGEWSGTIAATVGTAGICLIRY